MIDVGSPTWGAVKFYCRKRMRELAEENMALGTTPDRAAELRGAYEALKRLVEECSEGAEKMPLDRPDLDEESFEP